MSVRSKMQGIIWIAKSEYFVPKTGFVDAVLLVAFAGMGGVPAAAMICGVWGVGIRGVGIWSVPIAGVPLAEIWVARIGVDHRLRKRKLQVGLLYDSCLSYKIVHVVRTGPCMGPRRI